MLEPVLALVVSGVEVVVNFWPLLCVGKNDAIIHIHSQGRVAGLGDEFEKGGGIEGG